MRRALTAATAFAAVAALAAAAAASIVLRVTPRELADTAGLVAEGRVTAVDVRWNAGHTAINTYVSFNVERTLKGTTAGSLVIKVPGGRVGDEELRVEGTAKFAVDDEAMVFLWKDVEGDWIVLGEGQGKFRLFTDRDSGVRMAENSLDGLCLVVRSDPKGKEAPAASRKRDLLARDDLARTVRDAVDAAKGTQGGTAGGDAGSGAGTGGQPAPDGTATDPDAGRDPAPPAGTPDPPTTTPSSDEGAPPPTKDDAAPPAEESNPAEDGTPPTSK